MGLDPNTPMTEIRLDKIFSSALCTNFAHRDLRAAAAIVRGRRVASSVKLAMVVPRIGTGEGAGREGGPGTACSGTPGSSGGPRLLDVPRR